MKTKSKLFLAAGFCLALTAPAMAGVLDDDVPTAPAPAVKAAQASARATSTAANAWAAAAGVPVATPASSDVQPAASAKPDKAVAKTPRAALAAHHAAWSIAGNAVINDSGSIQHGDRIYHLAHIAPRSDGLSITNAQRFVSEQGGVKCTETGVLSQVTCATDSGVDLGWVEIRNGAAAPAKGAPASYSQAAQLCQAEGCVLPDGVGQVSQGGGGASFGSGTANVPSAAPGDPTQQMLSSPTIKTRL